MIYCKGHNLGHSQLLLLPFLLVSLYISIVSFSFTSGPVGYILTCINSSISLVIVCVNAHIKFVFGLYLNSFNWAHWRRVVQRCWSHAGHMLPPASLVKPHGFTMATRCSMVVVVYVCGDHFKEGYLFLMVWLFPLSHTHTEAHTPPWTPPTAATLL